jgi:hypothetical protein
MSVDMTDLRVQNGKQTAWDTAVAATKMARGVENFTIDPDIDIRVLEDMSLGYAGSTVAAVLKTGGMGNMSGWATYEQLPLWLDSLIEEDATPAGSDPYDYVYAAPISSLGTQTLYTAQITDATDDGYALVGALANELTLTQGVAETLNFDLGFIGYEAAADVYDSIAIPAVNPILATHLTTIHWDAWGDAPGTTSLANCYVRNMVLNINANRNPRYCYGSSAANSYRTDPYTGRLELTLEFNSTTQTDIDAIVGGTLTQKNVRLTWADTSDRGLVIDFAGVVAEMPTIFEDDDGVATVTVTLDRMYNSNWGSPNWLAMTVTNQESDMFA